MRGSIVENLRRVQDRIANAAARAGRSAGAITLVAVTKGVGIPEIELLREQGIAHFGENRVQIAAPKIAAIHKDVIWHMIGTVQRRKAKDVVRLFSRVDSVDRMELGEELAARYSGREDALPILLEVNVSGETAKHGFAPSDLVPAVGRLKNHAGLHIEGLMTMAPLLDDPNKARPVFAQLRSLAEELGLPRVSMGMSNDFEVAIEEGSTEVRIGTALFE